MANKLLTRSYVREGSFPIDANSIFSTYSDLTSYCKDPYSKGYNGQIVTVTSDTNSDNNGTYRLEGEVGSFTAVLIENKLKQVILTEAEYEALETKDANTIYYCT